MMLSLKAAGISREQVWIQHSSEQGDLAVASYETDYPEQSFKVLFTFNELMDCKISGTFEEST